MPEAGPKSTTKSLRSSMRSKVLSGKKMGDDQLQQYLNQKGAAPIQSYADQPEQYEYAEGAEGLAGEEEKEVAFEDADNVDALPDSVSQVKPTQS